VCFVTLSLRLLLYYCKLDCFSHYCSLIASECCMLKLLDYNFWFIVLLFIPCGVACILLDPHEGPVLWGSVTETDNGELMSAGPRYFPSKCSTPDQVVTSWAHCNTAYGNNLLTTPKALSSAAWGHFINTVTPTLHPLFHI
jgi:hypothetical protein